MLICQRFQLITKTSESTCLFISGEVMKASKKVLFRPTHARLSVVKLEKIQTKEELLVRGMVNRLLA